MTEKIMEYGEMMRLYGATNDEAYLIKANEILVELHAKLTIKRVRKTTTTTIEILDGQMNLFEGM